MRWSPLQIVAAQDDIGDLCRFVAEDEDAGRIGRRGLQAADGGDGLDRGKRFGFEGHQCLTAGRAKGGELALVFFDHDLVAGTQRDIQRRVGPEVLQPDLAGLPRRG